MVPLFTKKCIFKNYNTFPTNLYQNLFEALFLKSEKWYFIKEALEFDKHFVGRFMKVLTSLVLFVPRWPREEPFPGMYADSTMYMGGFPYST